MLQFVGQETSSVSIAVREDANAKGYIDSDFDSIYSNNVVCSNNNEPPSLSPVKDDNEETVVDNEEPVV